MKKHESKRKGLIRLLAIWEVVVRKWLYRQARKASKKPLDPKHMHKNYGQPITDSI